MNTKRQQHNPKPPTAADFLIASRQCELMNLQYFLQMGKVVQSISNLVHGLQRGRAPPTCSWARAARNLPTSGKR